MKAEQAIEILRSGAQGVKVWNELRLRHATGAESSFNPPYLHRADLSGLNLSNISLHGCQIYEANLSGTNLHKAFLSNANLWSANLVDADLSGADLSLANLALANLSGANLSGANLNRADFSKANLIGANLTYADLTSARLIDTDLTNADLSNSSIYGISVWNVKLQNALQHNLIISNYFDDENNAVISVDNIEVAQFIFLLLNNESIRNVIDTITSKVTLILGRFTPKRKKVLDAIRELLRERGYCPVIFDFEKPASRDTHETITTLARLARFVIADLSDPKSIPQELVSIVETIPSLIVQPIIEVGKRPWGMYDHIQRYPWVLPIYRYSPTEILLENMAGNILEPIELKLNALKSSL